MRRKDHFSLQGQQDITAKIIPGTGEMSEFLPRNGRMTLSSGIDTVLTTGLNPHPLSTFRCYLRETGRNG
jgi:hypothetical protein